MTKRKRKAKGRAAEPKDRVSLTMPTGWDLGAAGPANRTGLILEERGELDPETGKTINPNGVKGARRIDNLEIWHNSFLSGKRNRAWITTEQYNTAVLIRAACENTERAPGTDYSRPRVDSSPKPDHAVTIQIDRISAMHRVMARICREDEPLILHCVRDGHSPSTYRRLGRLVYAGERYNLGMPALRDALDRAAY